MKRIDLFQILNDIYPCFNIGEHTGEIKESYTVIKYENQITGVNSAGGWQYVNIFCYAPLYDITVLADMCTNIIKALKKYKDTLEFTGEITPEVVDDTVKAYCRRIKYRIPKEVI